jgi:hypothetical protein
MKEKISPLVKKTLAKNRTCIWLAFSRSSQWVHKHNLSTPQSTHKRMPHQATWLYHAVVAGEELALVISKWGKDFTYFLWLQTQWWWQTAHAVFMWILSLGPDSMYKPKFHSLNGCIYLRSRNTRSGQMIYYIFGAVTGITENESKMRENLRSRNLKLGFHCISTDYFSHSFLHQNGYLFWQI